MSNPGTLLAYGDPHGDFVPLFRAVKEHSPSAVLIVGDFDPPAPLRVVLAPLLEAGIDVRWIPGNHEGDSQEWYDRTFGDMPERSLHGRCATLAGARVVGLGGVFRERVWWPRDDAAAKPEYRTRVEARRAHGERKTPPLRQAITIFPEDWERAATNGGDILVCHEAPTSHPYGFAAIDALARRVRARLVIHGHHHRPHEGRIEWPGGGCAVRGLGRAEPWVVELPSPSN
ncbi:metallophosphoesterase family protein [Falsiroseomonas sp.]|uniref:metallophosphoesterase family protein n=1 Tax=Falsiroseomonas sp. TaxID=2870721 RepID=UPI003F6EE8C5